MKLFLSGREFQRRTEPPSVTRVKKFLDETKDGELFTTILVADALELNVKTIDLMTRYLDGYVESAGHGVRRYYGKPATITELRKQTNKEKGKKR